MPIEQFEKNLAVDFPFMDRTLFHIGETPITIGGLIVAAAILVVAWILSWFFQRAVARGLKIRGVTTEGTVGATRRLVHYAVMLLGTLLALRGIGIDLSTLFAAGAVFAIGLGFALQNIVQNFVSGVILLLERSIKPGDVLEVEGRLVKVRKMGIRATVAATLDEEEIIVPNAAIVQSTVKNYTLGDSVYRLRATVGVVYRSDMRLVKATLESTARALEWRLQGRDPLVILVDFADSAVVWEVSVWIDNPWQMRRTQGALRESIWWAFQEAGIVIAFPQLDVHFDPPVESALEGLRMAS